jgi:ERCC4-type nuclease
MDELCILIDDREKNVIPFFKINACGINYKVTRVTIGDYAVLYRDKILFIIERKTWADLASSIKDGRKNNVKKMIKARNDTNCILIYLIEGNPIPSDKSKYGRIPYKNLRSHLDHLIFRDNIHIIHSKDMDHTSRRIYELVRNYNTITPSILKSIEPGVVELGVVEPNDIEPNDIEPNDIEPGVVEPNDIEPGVVEPGVVSNGGYICENSCISGIDIMKQKFIVSEQTIIYKIWCCLPQITERTAMIFIDKKYHISDLLLNRIDKDTIFNMKYTSGAIIGKRSNKIHKISIVNNKHIYEKGSSNKFFIKMLVCLNGITKKTGAIILNNISFKDLLENKVSINELKDIQKTTKTKLGEKAAIKILKYFSTANKK